MQKIEQVIRTYSLAELFIIIGESLKVFYWNKYKEKKRIYSFFGMILAIKKNLSYHLMNVFNTELVNFKVPSFSPAILKPIKMFIYRQLFFKANKIKFIKKVFFKIDIFENTHVLTSTILSWFYNMLDFFPPRIYSILYYRKGRRQFLVYRHRI